MAEFRKILLNATAQVFPLLIFPQQEFFGSYSVLLGKRPVLLRADFVLTKDPRWPCEGQIGGKIDTEGSCGKAAWGP